MHFPSRGRAKCRLGRLHFFKVAVLVVAASSNSGEKHNSRVEDGFLDGLYFVQAI